MGYLDYKIGIDGKVKTYHANLLKKFFRRNDDDDVACVSVVDDGTMEENEEGDDHPSSRKNLLHLPTLIQTESLHNVLIKPQLD